MSKREVEELKIFAGTMMIGLMFMSLCFLPAIL